MESSWKISRLFPHENSMWCETGTAVLQDRPLSATLVVQVEQSVEDVCVSVSGQ